MQVETPNHLKLRWSKATVVNVKGKVGAKTSAGMFYGDDWKGTADEVSKLLSDAIKTGASSLLRD
ncbi:MAG: hypothetical protein DDT20_01167 [Firmicutes bacterium]|nr:hypothetical protein [Bacillota bacterium]